MERIIEIIKEIKPTAVVDENTRLLDDHVLDSLSMVSLVSELCDEYDVDITPVDVELRNSQGYRRYD